MGSSQNGIITTYALFAIGCEAVIIAVNAWWPGAGYMRCCDDGSPFLLFCFFRVERKAAGRAMLQFLEAIDV